MDNISKIQNKYSDFFNLLIKKELNKGIKYVINKNGSIDVFCDDNDFIRENHLPTIFLNSNINYIPPNIKFHGNLDSSYSLLKKIGSNVIADGYIKINIDSDFEGIGKGLCAESLYIYCRENFKVFPSHIKIENKITLMNCNIQEFGENIKAKSLEIKCYNYRENYYIKNIENLEIEELIINDEIRLNNINKIKNLKTIECKLYWRELNIKGEELINHSPSPEKTKIRLANDAIVLDHEMTEDFLKTIKRLEYINIYNNYLIFKSPNSFCSKLINEEYDLITEEEIKKYSNIKEFLIGENKIPVNIIDYCVGPKGISYLKQLGFQFTKDEIKTNKIKKLKCANPSFFEILEKEKNSKIEYKINEDISIDVFCKDKNKKKQISFSNEMISSIPSKVTFYEDMYIYSSILKTIGKKIITKGSIKIDICNDLESIGEGLCAEIIHISDNKSLKAFPDHTKAKKIILECCNIQEFGKNIKAQLLEIIKKDYKNYSIKNMENLEVENLIINDIRLKNINKIKNLKRIGYLLKEYNGFELSQNKFDDSEFILDHETTEGFLKTIKRLGYINSYLNYLDFKSPNSFCSKLINEEYYLITEKDIQECVLSNNNKEVLISENKIPINIIDYCVDSKGISYLKKIGYKFTKEELNKITDPQIKSNYEKELIHQDFEIKKMTKLNKKSFSIL